MIRSSEVIFILQNEDVMLMADQLGIPRERITDDILRQVKKGVEFGLEYWPDVVKVAIQEALDNTEDKK